MKNKSVVYRVIILTLTLVILDVSARNQGFSGFVGCKIDPDVCQEYEFCADDCLFGSCQSPEYTDDYCYDLTTSQLKDLGYEVRKLVGSRQSWQDLSTQCIVGNILLSYRSGLPYDPSFCESSPIRREIEDEISASAARLLEKYFSDYYGDQLQSDYNRQLLDSEMGNTDSIDLTDYPYPYLVEGYQPSRETFNDISTRSGGSDVLGNPREYFPINKKDEYVQVHKYLKSHKRDPGLSYGPYSSDYYVNDYPTSEELESLYAESKRGSPFQNDGYREEDLFPVYENEDIRDYEDLINRMSPSDLAMLYKYLTGEEEMFQSEEGENSDAESEESPVTEKTSRPVMQVETRNLELVTDLVPVEEVNNEERKLVAEDMADNGDEEVPAMTPEDAKLLGDILEGEVKVSELSDSEVSRLSVYVDDILGELLQEGGEYDRQTEEEQNPDTGDSLDDSPAGKFAEALFGETEPKSEEVINIRPTEEEMFKNNDVETSKRGGEFDNEEADVKDLSFNDATPKAVPTSVFKYGLLKNDKIWFKTKQKDVKLPDAQELLQQLENLLKAKKLLTQDTNHLKIGEGNITVRLDPTTNNSGYNASYIAKFAVAHRFQLQANDPNNILIEDAGVGEGDDIVSVNEINHSSPKYFVLTFVLCGAVAGIVLAVIIIYIFRRHVLSKEKLQQLGGLGEVEAEASKDYQDLCRQRMQSKTSDKPEPVHVAGRIGSASEVPRSSHSSRSSTSSWSEEPAVTNMDISTGHIVLSYMEDHLKNKDRLDQEWEGLVAYEAEPNSTAVASEPANMRKNRYSDMLPYDHSRVVLNGATNVSGSDYINASTITDHDPRNPAYIATQGPLPHTVADFWQMVWEQGSVVIVNLTKLTEGGNAMCHRYWPEEGSDLYHIYEVHLVSEHIWCDDYLVRSFYLKNLQTNETRTVTQFHFLSWYDLDIPSSIKALLDFRRKVNKSYRGRSCPIVVQCSDGSGRSGTYALIDMVLNRMSKGAKEIDIAATLEHIRDQRMQMVKTKQQFEFALASVAEEVTAILKALPQ